METQPLLVLSIRGLLTIYATDAELAYEDYEKIKAIAEDKSLYEMNATCVNPDVLAFQFAHYVRDTLGIVLKPCKAWPKMELGVRRP
jgi:hypothetical protein